MHVQRNPLFYIVQASKSNESIMYLPGIIVFYLLIKIADKL